MNESIVSTSHLVTDLPGLRPNRACRPCVKIKAKCVPLAGSERSTCERCSRLGKECTTPAPVSRKGFGGHGSSKFKAGSDAHPSTTISSTALATSSRSVSTEVSPPDLVQRSSILPVEAQLPTPISLDNPPSIPLGGTAPESAPHVQEFFYKSRTQSTGNAFDISPEIAHVFVQSNHEILFEKFRLQMSPHFPFITLNHEASVMRRERPFTYVTCVMAANHRDPPFQYRVARDILRYLGEHMLLNGEKSLDILQGLLIMMNWYHIYAHSNPQLMNILHLAKALLVDLGLNRPPGTGLSAIKLSNDGMKMIHGLQLDGHESTLEEHRAYLALYHVCFQLSACLHRLDPMCWTEYLDECCRKLEDVSERPSDVYAVTIVRLDRLVDRYMSIDDGQNSLAMPMPAYVKLFSADIEAFKQGLPLQLRNETSMNAHIQSSRLLLFERVLNSVVTVPAHKVEALHACLSGVTDYFDSLIAQHTDSIPNLPFIFWSTIAHAYDILAKLSFIEVEHWDLNYVRNSPGFDTICDRLVDKFKEVQTTEETQHPAKADVRFKIFINRIEQFKKWYLSRLDLESKDRSERVDEEAQMSAVSNDPLFGSRLGDFADLLWQDLTPDWGFLDASLNTAQY